MKRITYMFLLLLSIVSSCSKIEDNSTVQPLCIKAVSQHHTKGYVVSSKLEETQPEYLHSSENPTTRNLILSAHLHGIGGEDETYFKNEIFFQTDNIWTHEPEIYWPFGSTIDFIAYSSSIAIPSAKVTYDKANITNKMDIVVDGTNTQNDILYTCKTGCTNNAGLPVELTFKHAQAWIEFEISCDLPLADQVRFDCIEITDTYTDGTLSVTHPYGYAQAEWSFRFSTAKNIIFDDVNDVNGTILSNEPIYLDMLLPEQDKTSIILHYTYMTDPDKLFEIELPLTTSTWQMGKKYIYEIIVKPNKITINPTICDWDNVLNESNIPS